MRFVSKCFIKKVLLEETIKRVGEAERRGEEVEQSCSVRQGLAEVASAGSCRGPLPCKLHF